MCSIMYQPCDEQSFRIGPSSGGEPGMLNMGTPALMMDPMLAGVLSGMMGGANGGGGGGAAGAGTVDNLAMDAMPTMQSPALADDPNMLQMMDAATTMAAMMSSAATPDAGECLSDDGRRIGNCFNAYECRAKGGTAKGECAMGFGVCCICE